MCPPTRTRTSATTWKLAQMKRATLKIGSGRASLRAVPAGALLVIISGVTISPISGAQDTTTPAPTTQAVPPTTSEVPPTTEPQVPTTTRPMYVFTSDFLYDCPDGSRQYGRSPDLELPSDATPSERATYESLPGSLGEACLVHMTAVMTNPGTVRKPDLRSS